MPKRIIGSVFIALAVALAGLAIVPAQRTAAASPTAPYYLSLGDSLAQGVQPDANGNSVETNQGYADDLLGIESLSLHHLHLAKLGCPGETTTTMITGGICTYSTGNQLSEAIAFLSTHVVKFVTIDIGANNVDGCIVNGVVNLQCIADGIAAAQHDMPIILQALRTAAPGVPIFGMSYYDPFLAAWFLGPSGQLLAHQSVLLAQAYNAVLRGAYHAFHIEVANVQNAFSTTRFVNVPNVNLPLNVVLICQWTWMCAAPPVGPNIHANAAGYEVIAITFATTIGRVGR